MEILPLRVDLHSHLIPAIDDGAQSEEESLSLVRGLYDLGYRKFITTPHIYHGLFNNTPLTISTGLQKLKRVCENNKMEVEVKAAAEYFFDNYFFEQLEKKELLTFGDNFFLFELPMHNRLSMMEEMIFKMNLSGYRPVLAHPERYPYFHDKKMRDYKRLKEQGVYFQLNLMSITGHYNNAIRQAARDLIHQEMIDFLGTDIHHPKHLAVIKAARQDQYYHRLMSSGKLLNDLL